jgi:histidine ammonia-lyase
MNDAPGISSTVCEAGSQLTSPSSIVIDGSLSRQALYAIVDGAQAQLGELAKSRMRASHSALIAWLEEGRGAYGASSGVGDFRDLDVASDKRAQFQLNIVRSHCCGVGPALPSRLVRAALALRIATFACGYSAVRPALAEHMVEMLNACIHPVVPEFGSVGASGDPVLLAHLALGIVGEGDVQIDSEQAGSGVEGFDSRTIGPIALESREGLALINGLDFTIGAATLIIARVEHLMEWADAIAALTLDALSAMGDPFIAEVQSVRGSGRHRVVADRIRKLRSNASERHEGSQAQDPYCLRCIPQVHGASWTAFDQYATTVDRELTAVIDNPLVFAEDGVIRHCGHFHGQELAFAADHLALAIANLANICQARLSLLLRGTSGLPRMLSPDPGNLSGLMMIETTSASLLARIRALAAPLSVHSISASSVQEDHTSMSWEAVRRTDALLPQLAYVLAAESLAATIAIRLRRSRPRGHGTYALFQVIDSRIGGFEADRPLGGDIEALSTMILQDTSSFADGA